MSNYINFENSKECQLVKEWEMAMNSYSFDPKKFAAAIYKDMPALTFKVKGRLHKGTIIIALNGADYYEVYLQSGSKTTLTIGEVCFDELGDVIDEYIESGKDKEEYN